MRKRGTRGTACRPLNALYTAIGHASLSAAFAILLLFVWHLVLPPAARAHDWPDSRVVGPLVCRADFSLAGMEGLLRDLAQLQTDLAGALGLPPGKETVELYLFHDEATYARYLKRYLPNVPYRRALYVKGKGPGRVFAHWSRALEVDLRHESTHAMLHAALPVVPLWLDEGLAVYFEVPSAERAFHSPHLVEVRRNARLGWTPKIEGLERKTTVADLGRAEYRDSWAWVHFLLHGSPEAKKELTAFLADIASGNPPGVLSARLRGRVPDLQQRFSRHFRTWEAGPNGSQTSLPH